MSKTPLLEGIHHLKLPVSDIDRSYAWYHEHLGYEAKMEFVESGTLVGIAMAHPNGGPSLALRVDPDRAAAASGFDFFTIGVPGKDAIDALVAHLDEEGVPHNGVARTPVGWVLSGIHDPDGYNVRFYTVPVELPAELAEPIVRES
jgi:catechol 2,3-dioxygenase-like lactoylglutathione lyase family enzyme